jgi:N-carbamoyl-L-amino-acid hydrolase
MRTACSPADLAARDWIDRQLAALGMRVRRDSAGNTIAEQFGRDPEAHKPLAIGSHTDTVPNGGRFDGALGVVAALACARALRNAQVTLRHPLEIINFIAEEATLSGGTTGSLLMCGRFNPAQFDQPAWDGRLVRNVLSDAGIDPARWREAARAPGSLAAFVELHIEQGDALERAGVQIGLVEGLVGIRRLKAIFVGEANHAGTTPMLSRHDALVAAAPFVQQVRDTALALGITGTVGTFSVHPGAPNVIPGRVEMTVELRALHAAELDRATAMLVELAAQRGGALSPLIDKAPTLCDPHLIATIDGACESLGLSRMRLPSGAFHDAANMSALCPSAMLFVPSVRGVSHHPDEYTHVDDCINGANALLHTLLALDVALP